MAGRLQDVIRRDTRANQPAATGVPAGTLYYVTDEGKIERSTGSAWESVSETLAGLGVTASAAELNILDGATLTTTELNYVDGVTSAIQTQIDAKQATLSGATLTAVTVAGDDKVLIQDTSDTNNLKTVTAQSIADLTTGVTDGDKGDITVSGTGATWTIDNDAVTYAKMQNVSAASKLLGRGDSGAGDPEEITLGTGLTMTGTTLSASGGGGGSSDWDTTVTKASDETINNSATVQADNELLIAVTAGEVWHLQALVAYIGTPTGDIRFQWLIDGVALTASYGSIHTQSLSSSDTGQTLNGTAAQNTSVGASDTIIRLAKVEGLIHAQATGNLQLGWSQNSATAADTTVKAGSILRAKQII
jgi:hypothetical protein